MLIPLFSGDGEDDRFGFGIGLGSEAGLDPAFGDEHHLLDQTELFENPDEPSGGVGLSPVHAVTGGAGESVVVIVPTFTHGKNPEEEVVAAGIGGFKGATAEGVTDRVHRPGDVLVHEKANEAAPNQTTEGTHQNRFSEKHGSERADACGNEKTCEDPEPPRIVDGNNDGVFQKGGSVALDVRFKVVENPTGVGVPEAFEGAMGIFLFVRVGVVLNVSRRPVKGRALHGHGTADEEESF